MYIWSDAEAAGWFWRVKSGGFDGARPIRLHEWIFLEKIQKTTRKKNWIRKLGRLVLLVCCLMAKWLPNEIWHFKPILNLKWPNSVLKILTIGLCAAFETEKLKKVKTHSAEVFCVRNWNVNGQMQIINHMSNTPNTEHFVWFQIWIGMNPQPNPWRNTIILQNQNIFWIFNFCRPDDLFSNRSKFKQRNHNERTPPTRGEFFRKCRVLVCGMVTHARLDSFRIRPFRI